jgi:hypothetical protein
MYRLVLLFGALFTVCSCAASGAAVEPCVFPAPPRSAIASAIPVAGDSAFRGRVVTITMSLMENALVRIEPGAHMTQTDSSGRFQFVDVPRGRYLGREV